VVAAKYCYRHPDRETGLSCTECGRPICVDCMRVAPVGIRCPDHAGSRPREPLKPVRSVQRAGARRGVYVSAHDPIVTRALIVANIVVYLITIAQGGGISQPGGRLFAKWILWGPFVKHGDWWRLVTATFLHGGLLHIALNMWVLWAVGPAVEGALGKTRFLLLYFASGLAGSAGALVLDPTKPVVGASGAIFGLFGAGFILEWRATGRVAGQFLTLIVINLAFTLALSSYISVGGHIGGLIGGILGTAIIVYLGRIYRRFDPAIVGLVALAALSVIVAYWKVRGLA
jgi:membrane associated rhomboid family serine protease